MRNRPFRRACGFTLIETIITLVVLGIAAAMMVVFFGPGVTKSSDPIFALQNDADLQAVMENMIEDARYVDDPIADAATWANLKTGIQNNTTGYGDYVIERNCYCALNASNTFVCDADQVFSADKDFLCVTISHPNQSGSKISYLFKAP